MSAEILSQPPPDVPAPPPGTSAKRSRRWFIGILVIGLLSLAFVGGSIAWKIQSHRRLANEAKMERKLRSLGMALFDFSQEYGSYPSAVTAAQVKRDTGTSLTFGDTSSNDLFKQLMGAVIVQTEVHFHAPGGSTRLPDNVARDDATALAAGECGLAYVAGVSRSDPPKTPLVIAPAIAGTRTFNTKAYGNRVVVLHADGTVATYAIDDLGRIAGPGGMDLFDPRQPFWQGRTPDVKWPK